MQQRAIPGSPRSLRASLSFDDVESPGKLKAAFQLLRVRRRRALVLLALLSLLPLREMQNIPLEITYEDVKYSFTVSPRGPDTILL